MRFGDLSRPVDLAGVRSFLRRYIESERARGGAKNDFFGGFSLSRNVPLCVERGTGRLAGVLDELPGARPLDALRPDLHKGLAPFLRSCASLGCCLSASTMSIIPFAMSCLVANLLCAASSSACVRACL